MHSLIQPGSRGKIGLTVNWTRIGEGRRWLRRSGCLGRRRIAPALVGVIQLEADLEDLANGPPPSPCPSPSGSFMQMLLTYAPRQENSNQ